MPRGRPALDGDGWPRRRLPIGSRNAPAGVAARIGTLPGMGCARFGSGPLRQHQSLFDLLDGFASPILRNLGDDVFRFMKARLHFAAN